MFLGEKREKIFTALSSVGYSLERQSILKYKNPTSGLFSEQSLCVWEMMAEGKDVYIYVGIGVKGGRTKY